MPICGVCGAQFHYGPCDPDVRRDFEIAAYRERILKIIEEMPLCLHCDCLLDYGKKHIGGFIHRDELIRRIKEG